MISQESGFTLVELIVVICILGVLITVALISINPFKQITKTQDAQRFHDLIQIQTALDSYYDGHNMYPQTLSFGEKFSENNTVYMNKVPQDPLYPIHQGYLYAVDPSQAGWVVLFVELANTPTQQECSLPAECLPANFTKNWACRVSGNPNCTVLSAFNLSQYSQSAQNVSTSPSPTSIPVLQPVACPNYQNPNPADTCQFTYKIYPTYNGEMLEHFNPVGGSFMICNPSFQGNSWYGDLGMYKIDVSLNANFSGSSCDADTLPPPNINVNDRGKNCQTMYNFSQAYNWGGWVLRTFGNIAAGHIIEYPYGSISNSPIFAPQNLPASKFWANWQCRKTIYWRFHNWNNPSEITPIHSDTISCDLPQTISWNDWHTNYWTGTWNTSGVQVNYTPQWDADCNGKMDTIDEYLLNFANMSQNF